MKKGMITAASVIIAVVALATWVSQSGAYPTYSDADIGIPDNNCAACHGDFRDNNYISLSDGQNWGNLHNLHRFDMLGGDCATCHPAGSNLPVSTYISEGGGGFAPIGCMGCHGRLEDASAGAIGAGAGLRQHHFRNGQTICLGCHFDDTDPANFTPVGEDVPPPYYITGDGSHPNKPTDPCSPNGEEDYAGSADGLDNDGDDVYDGLDPDCTPVLLGDLNCDSVLDINDVGPFTLALVDPTAYGLAFPGCDINLADMNGNGPEDGDDVQLFVDALVP